MNVDAQLKTEGKAFIDGEEIIQAISATCTVTLNNTSSKTIGSKTSRKRAVGYEIQVVINSYKTDKIGMNILKNYYDKGLTPSFTIQLMNNDKASDYFKKFGNDVITCKNCVPTGSFNLMDLDAASTDHVQQSLTFDCESVA